MKGIILAGGTGSRLWPATGAVNKQLLPIYDKPLIYYPLSTLLAAGIQEILIICNPNDLDLYRKLFRNSDMLGIELSYAVQEKPNGIAEALIIGKEFVGNQEVALILGDNLFHGIGLGENLKNFQNLVGAHIFTYHVANPENYGVLTLDKNGAPTRITEKPLTFESNLAITGLYFLDHLAVEFASSLVPSSRGELEITSLLSKYLDNKILTFSNLSRGTAWFDTGNPDSISDAAAFVRAIQDRTGQKIGCIEEICFNNGWVNQLKLQEYIDLIPDNNYTIYLKSLIGSK